MSLSTEYGKIETLFNRDKATFKVIVDRDSFRLPEFGLVNRWIITEKVDGTNIRIEYWPRRLKVGDAILVEPGSEDEVLVKGRTDNADLPPFLLDSINELVTLEKLQSTFDQDAPVVLYGEGYGARIQKGGGSYREGTSFRLFDVRVGDWWLNWENVEGVAASLGIKVVPSIGGPMDVAEAMERLSSFESSLVAFEDGGKQDLRPEGIVARTNPLLFTRKGERLMWKIKHKDFA